MTSDATSATSAGGPSGSTGVRPLDANERRVLGTLIEKGKTTPDQYPLSLNALVTGCNQKSNRDPVMVLDEEQVTRAILSLKACGAMAEVFGSGKIPRYRHLAYEWLGVEKEELAIIGELLLRGEQSEGDLRGRASRMDPIPDLDTLRGHLDRLAARGLIVWLSPPGRGRILTHGLLPPEKLEKVRAQLGLGGGGLPARDSHDDAAPAAGSGAGARADAPARAAVHALAGGTSAGTADLESRIARLEEQVAEALRRLDALDGGAAAG